MTDDEFYDGLLDRCGFRDGAEVTADGSASNDLAHDTAAKVLTYIDELCSPGQVDAGHPL